MARELSDLQKKILVLAYLNRNSKQRDTLSPRSDLSNREALVKIYGFIPVRSGGTAFDVEMIGPGRYNSATVATAKAFKRLCNRGLAKRNWGYGIVLTEKGLEVAKKLIG